MRSLACSRQQYATFSPHFHRTWEPYFSPSLYRRQHLWGNFSCAMCEFFAFYPDEYASHMLGSHKYMEGGVRARCAECGEEVQLGGSVHNLVEHYRDALNGRPQVV